MVKSEKQTFTRSGNVYGGYVPLPTWKTRSPLREDEPNWLPKAKLLRTTLPPIIQRSMARVLQRRQSHYIWCRDQPPCLQKQWVGPFTPFVKILRIMALTGPIFLGWLGRKWHVSLYQDNYISVARKTLLNVSIRTHSCCASFPPRVNGLAARSLATRRIRHAHLSITNHRTINRSLRCAALILINRCTRIPSGRPLALIKRIVGNCLPTNLI